MKNNKKTEWFIQTRGTILLYRCAPAILGLVDYWRTSESKFFESLLAINIGEKYWWVWSEPELRRFGKLILTQTKTKRTSAAHFAAFDRVLARAFTAAERVRTLSLSEFSSEALAEAGEKLYNECKDSHGLLNLAADAFDYYPLEHVQATIGTALSGLPEAERNLAVNSLLTISCTSYLALEERAILEAALYDGNIEKITESFWWTGLGWESVEAKDDAYFLKAVAEARKDTVAARLKLDEIKNQPAKVLTERERLIEKYDVGSEIKHLLELFDRYAYYHDKRKEMQMKVMWGFDLLRREAIKRLKLDAAMSEWLWPRELHEALRGKTVDMEELKRRSEAVAVCYKDGLLKTYSGEAAVNIKKRELDEVSRQVSEFKGMPASGGIAVGPVKICAGGKEAMIKMRKGDVLVTGMTLPDYVPAMKLACAIVTDEGGITSHAAIVSRELKKPCVIGTKIATKVLKDGMTVEVDANTGVVKIIS